MSDTTTSDSADANDSLEKRSLPPWMLTKDPGNRSPKKEKNDGESGGEDSASRFSELMEGVVFALSGFVNPERSTLRSRALEMGAEYRPDWSSDCTLLVCAFPNTPKFRQVESNNGTIVSKEWISECYNQKKLVDIESYLMHAGKPWKKKGKNTGNNQGGADHKTSQPKKPKKQVERRSQVNEAASASSKARLSNAMKNLFSPSKVKSWAADDLKSTESWLESQEQKPEAHEIRMIAAEGIITCLQDAIEALEQNHDVRHVTEQWKFVPHVVKELAELECGKSNKESLSKEELIKLAITCKNIYESELNHLDSSPAKKKQQKTDSGKEVWDDGFDSDQTIEMTEEEIEIACRHLNSEHF